MNRRKIALAGALSLALSLLAFAEGIPEWKWDESQHPADVKDAEPSAATAIAVATFDVQGSSSRAFDSVFSDWGASVEIGLDSLPRGMLLIVR